MSKYYKVFKSPVWIVLDPTAAKYEATKKWLIKAGSLFVPDVSLGFKETVESFATRGWSDRFKEGVALPDQLINVAFVEHVKKNTISSASFSFPTNLTCRLDRKLSTEEDYRRIFNELLSLVSNIELSYLFQIQEKCFNPKAPVKCFLTDYGFNNTVVNNLSDKIITIGDGPDFNIDLTTSPKSVSSFLEAKLTAILGETV